MDYTTQTPTVPGYYWNRDTPPGTGPLDSIVEVQQDFDGNLGFTLWGDWATFAFAGKYWAGPILPPTTYTGPIGGGVALGIDPTGEDRHCLDNNDLH